VLSAVLKRLSTLSTARRGTSGDQLTAREFEILDLVAKGLPNKRIAALLQISHATAKNHVHHILGKLQLRSRSEVAAYLGAMRRDRTESAPQG
jgi:DNA-binding NarL/FixJ family response regulator